jgi:hypothetical protein
MNFDAYAGAFDFFNTRLFEGDLPRCILNFSRRARSGGFFAPFLCEHKDGRTHEISLNPDCLKSPPRQTYSVLVHEMVHLWQQEHGRPSRGGYHNREYAKKMETLGLMTSQTGAPGGARTGQEMSHYIIDGGPFDQAFAAMPEKFLLPWISGGARDLSKPDPVGKNKIKYTCPGCGANVWGKAGLAIVCTPCAVLFASVRSPVRNSMNNPKSDFRPVRLRAAQLAALTALKRAGPHAASGFTMECVPGSDVLALVHELARRKDDSFKE